MTIGGPQNIFPPSKEININFDWTDVASATGYVEYDCFTTLDSVGVNRLLVESRNADDLQSIYSVGGNPLAPTTIYAVAVVNTAYTKGIDVDFDSTEFQLPRIIKGKAYFSFYGGTRRTGGAGTALWYFVIRVRKWDGASETEIANVQTAPYTWVVDQVLEYSLDLDIPQTSFKRGEQLRITIEGWSKNSGGAGFGLNPAISGDPSNSAGNHGDYPGFAAGTTRIICTIPYKLNN